MAKNVNDFANNLCKILSDRRFYKTQLFDEIFEIFIADAERTFTDTDTNKPGDFWESVVGSKCPTSSGINQLFYTLSKKFIVNSKQYYEKDNPITKKRKNLPNILFFELLLNLILKLKQKFDSKNTLILKKKSNPAECLDLLKKCIDLFENIQIIVGKSDSSAILNLGIDDLDLHKHLTPEDPNKIDTMIAAIESQFTIKEYTRQGNYTLAHVIRSYCDGIIKKLESLRSELDKTGSDPAPAPASDMVSGDGDGDGDGDDDGDGDGSVTVTDDSKEDLSKYVIVNDDDEDDDTPHHNKPVYKFQQKPTSKQWLQLLHRPLPPRGSAVVFDDSIPMCRYKNECNRKSFDREPNGKLHFEAFQHPLGFIPTDKRPGYKPPWKPGGGGSRNKQTNRNSRRRASSRRTKRTKRRRTRHTRSRRR
jgi:hypothetical protein